MKKLIISTIVLLEISWANVVKAQANMIYTALIGGKCEKLILLGRDFSPYCKDKFMQMSLDNGRVVYMIPMDNGKSFSFSGGYSQQPQLDRFTLFLDTFRLMEGETKLNELKIVGTCEMWGNPDKEKTKHKCLAENKDGKMIFEFESDPNQIEVIN